MNAKVQLILELKERIKSGLSNAKKYVNQNVKDMKDSLNSLKQTHTKAFSAMADEVPGLGRAVSLLTNPYALAAVAVLALGAAYVKSVQMAAEWEKGMAKVNVTAQLSKDKLAVLSDEVRKIGANNYVPLEEVPNAFNKIISAGLDVKSSLAALDPVLKATKAGFADIDTVAAATVNTMNSTGIKDATTVLDVLFATLNKGNAEFNDIANYLPKILPMAQKAGISFQDTAGAFAYLTAQGFKAEAASTGLLNTFKALSDPKVTNNLKKIGVNVYDAAGKTKPFVTIIGDLKKQLNGLTDQQRAKKFDIAGFDSEATTAIGAMLTDYEKLGSIIDFTNKSQGQLNEALKNAETPMDVWMLVSNEVKNAMISLGQAALPLIKNMGIAVLSVIQFFREYKNTIVVLSYAVMGVAIAWGAYLAITKLSTIATGYAIAQQWLLNIAMNANPIGMMITGFGILIGVFAHAYNSSQEFRASLAGIREVAKLLGDVFMGLGQIILGAFTFNPVMFAQGVERSVSAIKNISDGGISKAYNQGYDYSILKSEVEKGRSGKSNNPFATDKPLDEGGGDIKPPAAISENKVIDSGQKVNNITVKIDALNKGDINANNTDGLKGMSAADIEKWLNDMLMRTIRNLETSYS